MTGSDPDLESTAPVSVTLGGIEEAELDADHAAMLAIVLMLFCTEWMER